MGTSHKTSRRSFLANSALSALALPFASRVLGASTPNEIEISLIAQAKDSAIESVSFGLPLPLKFLKNASNVAVFTQSGQELAAAVRSLEPWRNHGADGSIRSVLIQFKLDFTEQKTQRVKIRFGSHRQKNESNFVPVEQTLFQEDGLRGPRVVALIPPQWLCESGIVGPQVPSSESGKYRAYDDFVEKTFPGSLVYLNSQVYHEWLFDRTTCYYKMYVRTGELKYFSAAYHAANFMRQHTKLDGEDAGIFTLKGADLKYVYPRAMHIHYLLTGDERALAAGKLMARYCLDHQNPVYQPASLKPVALGVDPERGRNFWTLRHQGYGLLGVLHGWEMTGDQRYWKKAMECIAAYYKHQQQPPDGRPADGSLRQDWELYDPNEATFKGATSAWMMALLLDPLFCYWTMSGDKRVPQIILKWCDFLDRRGIVPDGSKAYYVINCFAAFDPNQSPGELGPDMQMHNLEMAYMFALGIFFSRDGRRREVYQKRFQRFFELALMVDPNHPARAFNWTFQFTSQLVYFMQRPANGQMS
jgi:hypothetical protein